MFEVWRDKMRTEDMRIWSQLTNLQNCAIRNISETALRITETKMETVFYRPKYPQNIGKLTSETTFGHLKVVFGHCYIQKS